MSPSLECWAQVFKRYPWQKSSSCSEAYWLMNHDRSASRAAVHENSIVETFGHGADIHLHHWHADTSCGISCVNFTIICIVMWRRKLAHQQDPLYAYNESCTQVLLCTQPRTQEIAFLWMRHTPYISEQVAKSAAVLPALELLKSMQTHAHAGQPSNRSL